eukprot:2560099-Alexandrium_andersonii.AAC.1
MQIAQPAGRSNGPASLTTGSFCTSASAALAVARISADKWCTSAALMGLAVMHRCRRHPGLPKRKCWVTRRNE